MKQHNATSMRVHGQGWMRVALGMCVIVYVVVMLVGCAGPESQADRSTHLSTSIPTPLVTRSAAPSASIAIVPRTPAATPRTSVHPTIPVPPKAVPNRLVIADAGIDLPLQRLPLTADQVRRRDFTPPMQPDGYWSQYTDQGYTYNDVPGAGMVEPTVIDGHSCAEQACFNTQGQLLPQRAWQLTRLSDPTKVKVGTAMSVFTANGEVCAKAVAVTHIQQTDVKAQEVILDTAAQRRYIVVFTCDAFGDIHAEATYVSFRIEPCAA